MILVLAVGGAVAAMGLTFSGTDSVSFGEVTYEQSDLVVQEVTTTGPGVTTDEVELVVQNSHNAAIDATAEVFLLDGGTEVTNGTLTQSFPQGTTTVSVPLDNSASGPTYTSLEIRIADS